MLRNVVETAVPMMVRERLQETRTSAISLAFGFLQLSFLTTSIKVLVYASGTK
jgi:hypothetical protein